MRTLCFAWIFLVGLFACHAQAGNPAENIRFTHIGLKQGLSHSTVFAIDQDKEGNLWFATYDGVNKYNGYDFTVYRNQYLDSTSIACDIARSLFVDESDRVWVGTRDGLSLYNREKNNFANYTYKTDGKDITVTSIVPLKKDWLMIGSTGGLLLFDVQRERFLNDTLSAFIHALQPTALARENDLIYIGTQGGVYTYSLTQGNLTPLFTLPKDIRPHAILCQMHTRVWIGTEGGGLFLYDAKTKELKNYRGGKTSGLKSDYVRSLALDSENRLWIGTYSGLSIYDEGQDNFQSITSSTNEEGSLSQNSVRCIFKDTQGGMWLGTYWGGLNYYHPLCDRFRHIKYTPSQNSLSDNVVSCIVEDRKRNLWIGTSDGGLNYYDKKSGTYTNYLFDEARYHTEVPFRDIKAVYIDEAQDKVYVGAHAFGLMVLDRRTGRRKYLTRANSNLPTNNVYSILPDDKDGLWIGTLEYLLYFNPEQQDFTIVGKDAEGNQLPGDSRLLYRDSHNHLWIGGEMGCAVYHQDGTKLSTDNDYAIGNILRRSFVNCFHESSSGTVWIGTRNGLFAVEEGAPTNTQYTTDNGLPSNVIYGILEDAYGRLWISTNQGLCCMKPNSGKFRNFTEADGLQSNQFNANSCCRLENGSMLFGGINGITLFRPETLVDNPFAPKPVINKLFVFNKEVLPNDDTGILKKSIENVDHITLASSQNSFAISFVVSNYIAGQHNTFSYRLDGYDKEWYTQENTGPVSYSNLPAGNYTFRVKAANNDGKWNQEAAVLHIRILPIWYQTGWAYTLFALIIIGLIGGVIRYFWLRKSMQTEILMERLDKEKREEINQMTIRFYVNISHELRTPLTLIVAPLQELLARVTGHWERERLQYIWRNTNRLLHLVNQLMDYRRAELGIFKLAPVRANAYKRIESCFVNYENLAKRKDIDYNFYSELQDENELFDANYLDLIVNNLLSNAFKYTEEGESITVKLYKEGDELVLQVIDTGIGIPKEKQKKIFDRFYQIDNTHAGSGIGLSLIQKLVESHHGRITLDSEPGKGSTFTVYLPQNESAYTPEELAGHTADEDERVYSTNAHDAYIEEEMTDEETADADETSKRGTILVVEDNDELRQYIVNGLSAHFNLLKAENGQKALEILKDNEVDLIITDVMMPVMDGVKFCKLVKQNLRTCHIPVYMLSAKTDINSQLQGLQVGADDYIPKPFSIEVLEAKILNILRTRYRNFERYSNTTEIEPQKLTNNSMDEELLKRAIAVVEKNMDNVDFSTEQFAREMNMSRSNLHLKLKAITGKSAIDFIYKIRFNRACQLLKEGRYSVSEISYMVGYNTPSYFAARFKKYVGCLPTEYAKKGGS